MQSQASVEIDRPTDDVFDATANVSEWSITCVEHELIDEKPEGAGTTFRIVTDDRGRRMEFRGVTTVHERPRRSAVHLEGDQFDIDVEYTFEDLAGRTRVTQDSKVQAKGLFRVFLFCFGWLFKRASCKAQENELASLKNYCEGAPAEAGSGNPVP